MAIEVPDVRESFSQAIYTVTLGATPQEGGTRERVITVGGERALPFHHFDGEIPHPPVVAMEVWDIPPRTGRRRCGPRSRSCWMTRGNGRPSAWRSTGLTSSASGSPAAIPTERIGPPRRRSRRCGRCSRR